jgi:hypothetical protein
MENFALIGELKDYAETKGWAFLSGSNAFRNYESTRNSYAKNQLILGVNFTARPEISKGVITEIRYPGLIFLGRKFESSTFSKLDETFIQKYNNRLKDLMGLLSNAVIDFACINELDIEGLVLDYELNQFDANLDFVGGNITFIQ